MIVDADVKNGKPGLQSLDLMSMLGADLDFVVATPSGGRHAYFTVPDDKPVPNSVDALPEYRGIDIRGDGGYVVAPGTPGYTLLADRPIPQAPEFLLTAARAKRPHLKQDPTPLVELDTDAAIIRAVDYLRTAPEAIEGAGGNDTTYRVLAWVKDLGISKELALELIEPWNEERASPPWSPDELATIAENVYAYGTAAPGKRSADAEFDAIPQTPDFGFARPVTYGTTEPPPREWAVDGLIPRYKTTLLSGDGGVGKSLLGQIITTCIATHQPFLGHDTIHGPIIAVFSEDDEDELHRRQIDINRSMSLTMDDLDNVNWWSADHVAEKGCMLMSFTRDAPEGRLGTFYRRLEEAIIAIKPAMILLDPVANMFGGSEIDRNQVTLFINRTINRLCIKHRTTALVLVHPSVAGMAEGSGRSGSTGWANAVRSRLYLSRPESDPSGDYRELTTTKANYGRYGESVMMRWSKGSFELVKSGGPKEDALLTFYTAVKDMIEEGMSLSDSPHSSRYIVPLVMRHLEGRGPGRSALKEAFDHLLSYGYLRVEQSTRHRGRPTDAVVLGLPYATTDDIFG